ncbi:Farnesol dehydrogenase [Anthophora plagiata]
MDRWNGKVAIVTGASSGIGAATSKALARHGVKVVGLARRLEKLKELQVEIGKNKFYPIECDVTKEQDIVKAFNWVEKELGGVDILVNNAGLAIDTPIIDAETAEDYHKVVDTNLIAPAICSREFSRSIKKRNAIGHIININSIGGLYAESLHIPLGMYCPSKYGLRALGTELRHEIILRKLKIKITNISPGAVLTDMLKGVARSEIPADVPMLKDHDIADAVMYALGTPTTVEIPEITVMPHNEIIGISQQLKDLMSQKH